MCDWPLERDLAPSHTNQPYDTVRELTVVVVVVVVVVLVVVVVGCGGD